MRAGWLQPTIATVAALLPAITAVPEAAGTPPAETPVRVRVVERGRPPNAQDGEPDRQTAESSATPADAVILENAYLRATVVPALGGWVTQVHDKRSGRDLLAGGEAGAGVGAGFRFPHPSAEPPPGEDVCWRIVRADDGAVTVAVDRRFHQFTGPRGAHFSPLRMGTAVTLRPASPVLEVTGRVDNPLPLRQGFRLWYAARFPAPAGATVLLPAGSVADAVLADVRAWPGGRPVPMAEARGLGADLWAPAPAGGWVGVYDPRTDTNRLLVRSRSAAPGTAVRLPNSASANRDVRGGPGAPPRRSEPFSPGAAGRRLTRRRRARRALRVGSEIDPPEAGPPRPSGRCFLPPETLEAAVGSNVTAGHPGHYLPPFGAYGMRLGLAMVRGIGPVVWADERMAVGLWRGGGATGLRVVGLGPPQAVRLVLRAGGRREEVAGRLTPDRPLAVSLRGRHARVRLTVLDAEDEALADVYLPLRAEPPGDESLAALRGQMDPWDGQAMEVAGWHPPPGRGGLPAAVDERTRSTAKVPVDRLLSAARVLMLAETPGAGPWQGGRSRLAFRADRGDHQSTAHAYVALMLTLEAAGRPTDEAARHAGPGCPVLGALYVRALRALASGDMATGLRHLRRISEQAPPIAMGLGDRALPGGDRLHPSAWPGGQGPMLLRALVRLRVKQPRRAASILERLLRVDPSRPEAVALLADACTRLGEEQTPRAAEDWKRAAALRAEADRLLEASPAARRDLEALREAAMRGRWRGIPQP